MHDHSVGLTITELPSCPWRELIPEGIRCRHARVHAMDDRVPIAVCLHCTQREVPCEAPRQPLVENQPELPPLWMRVGNFGQALVRHVADGGGQRTPAEIQRIFCEHCRACELFDGEHCTHARCGCHVAQSAGWLNKIAWASEHCPIGKW